MLTACHVCAESEAKVIRVEQQRMRTALLDAELELQQAAVASQSSRRSLQASTHCCTVPVTVHLSVYTCFGMYTIRWSSANLFRLVTIS